MQVLKEEVRESIRLAAIEEFKEKGYSSASMRSIAERCGLSVGNLYRYYSSKEGLFNFIVEPAYEDLQKCLNMELKFMFLDVNLMEHVELFIKLSEHQKLFRDELYILLEKSKESKYEATKNFLIERLEALFLENIISEVNGDKQIVQSKILAKVLSASLIEGFSYILLESMDDDLIQNTIEYLEFTFKSTLRTMHSMKDGTMNFRRISDEEILDHFNRNCIN